jgi:RNA polymerase sigma-70 factor, ECF subfamily
MGKWLPSWFPVSDEQAMWRVKMAADPQAFAELVARWEKPIQGLCARMTGNPHSAEDLAQEAFSRVFARRATYEASGRFSTFLWRIALNLCYDELRRRKRLGEHPLYESDEPAEPAGESYLAESPTPDVQLVERERAEQVRRALLQIAPSHRVVVVLRHYEGLKFREIAELLGIPEGTVKSRMAEALDRLNDRLNHLKHDEPCKRPLLHQTAPAR